MSKKLADGSLSLMSVVLWAILVGNVAADSVAPVKTVRVAAIQFVSRWAQPAENRKGLEPLVREAAKTGANIIGANWSVPDQPGWYAYGQTEVIARTGQVLARVKSNLGNEIVYADLPIPSESSTPPRSPKAPGP